MDDQFTAAATRTARPVNRPSVALSYDFPSVAKTPGEDLDTARSSFTSDKRIFGVTLRAVLQGIHEHSVFMDACIRAPQLLLDKGLSLAISPFLPAFPSGARHAVLPPD